MLIARVHPEILRAEKLPDVLLDEKDGLARPVSFDREFGETSSMTMEPASSSSSSTSRRRRRKRFLERIDEPEKNCKFSLLRTSRSGNSGSSPRMAR